MSNEKPSEIVGNPWEKIEENLRVKFNTLFERVKSAGKLKQGNLSISAEKDKQGTRMITVRYPEYSNEKERIGMRRIFMEAKKGSKPKYEEGIQGISGKTEDNPLHVTILLQNLIEDVDILDGTAEKNMRQTLIEEIKRTSLQSKPRNPDTKNFLPYNEHFAQMASKRNGLYSQNILNYNPTQVALHAESVRGNLQSSSLLHVGDLQIPKMDQEKLEAIVPNITLSEKAKADILQAAREKKVDTKNIDSMTNFSLGYVRDTLKLRYNFLSALGQVVQKYVPKDNIWDSADQVKGRDGKYVSHLTEEERTRLLNEKSAIDDIDKKILYDKLEEMKYMPDPQFEAGDPVDTLHKALYRELYVSSEDKKDTTSPNFKELILEAFDSLERNGKWRSSSNNLSRDADRKRRQTTMKGIDVETIQGLAQQGESFSGVCRDMSAVFSAVFNTVANQEAQPRFWSMYTGGEGHAINQIVNYDGEILKTVDMTRIITDGEKPRKADENDLKSWFNDMPMWLSQADSQDEPTLPV